MENEDVYLNALKEFLAWKINLRKVHRRIYFHFPSVEKSCSPGIKHYICHLWDPRVQTVFEHGFHIVVDGWKSRECFCIYKKWWWPFKIYVRKHVVGKCPDATYKIEGDI